MTTFFAILSGIPLGFGLCSIMHEAARAHERRLRAEEFSIIYGADMTKPLTWPHVRPERETWKTYRARRN